TSSTSACPASDRVPARRLRSGARHVRRPCSGSARSKRDFLFFSLPFARKALKRNESGKEREAFGRKWKGERKETEGLSGRRVKDSEAFGDPPPGASACTHHQRARAYALACQRMFARSWRSARGYQDTALSQPDGRRRIRFK